MRPSSFLLLAALCIHGFAAEPPGPDPQLIRLESELTRKLDDRRRGALPPDQYRVFAAQFRDELDKALAHAPPTPVNRGHHALILSRLDESGPGQALAGLDRALEAAPNDPALFNAKGSIQLQQGDYQGAFASASAILNYNQEHGQPPDTAALALYHSSRGRGTPGGGAAAAATALPAAKMDPPAAAARNDRAPILFTPRQTRARVEIPSVIDDASSSAVPSAVTRVKDWTTKKIETTREAVVAWVDGKVGLRPGEESIARSGATNGAVAGAVLLGGGASVVAAGVCGPAIATTAPYVACVGAAGVGGVSAGAFLGGYSGGWSSVMYRRFTKWTAQQLDEFGFKKEPAE